MSENPNTNPAADTAIKQNSSGIRANVRLIEPKNNLVAWADVTLPGGYRVPDVPVKVGKNGLYFDNPTKLDNGRYKDTFFPTTAEARQAMTEAIEASYDRAVERNQAIGKAQEGIERKPSIKDTMREAGIAAAEHNAQVATNAAPKKTAEAAL